MSITRSIQQICQYNKSNNEHNKNKLKVFTICSLSFSANFFKAAVNLSAENWTSKTTQQHKQNIAEHYLQAATSNDHWTSHYTHIIYRQPPATTIEPVTTLTTNWSKMQVFTYTPNWKINSLKTLQTIFSSTAAASAAAAAINVCLSKGCTRFHLQLRQIQNPVIFGKSGQIRLRPNF